MTLDTGLTEEEQEKETAAIREVMDQVLVAYGNQDIKTMTEISHDVLMSYGQVARGKTEVEAFWAAKFRQWGDQKVAPSQDLGIEFLAPNVAVWRGMGEFIDRTDPDGKPLPPQKYIGANVYIKSEGKWRRGAAFVMPIPDA